MQRHCFETAKVSIGNQTAFSTDCARPVAHPAPPGTTPRRASARETAWQAARSAHGSEPQGSGRSDWFKRLGRLLLGQGYAGIETSGTAAILWHTRRRGSGAVAGREAGTQEETTRTVVPRETAA